MNRCFAGVARRCLVLLMLLFLRTGFGQKNAQVELSTAAQGTSAIGVVVDMRSGRTLAVVGNADRQSTPGSLLKPLFLADALDRNDLTPQSTVFCRRDFHIHIHDGRRDWNVTCAHPQTNVAFTATEALAYSCNRYFAGLADRMTPAQAADTLAHYGFTAPRPLTREQKELLVLGLSGVEVSPRQIASAYRKLLLAASMVHEGLVESVAYGMAHNAAVPGKTIAGKTGTASDPGERWSHGWFAGSGPMGSEDVVLVVYLDHGNGGDAARLAQRFFSTAMSK
jgi:cell division protein FtsI/penicillin-binding protein 2